VELKIATELILEIRFMLISMNVDLEEPTLMLGYNMPVVLNTSAPSSVVKKKHYEIACNCV
jgi:hypothetical protein